MNAARHLFHTLVSLLILASLALSTTSVVVADDGIAPKSLHVVMPVKTVRPSFEYEQCFNGCQQAFDKAMTQCLFDVDPNDEQAQSACRQSAIKDFEQALSRCPVDTGRRDRR